MKYTAIITVDEESIRIEREDDETPLDDLVRQEFGWMNSSGISLIELLDEKGLEIK